MHAVWSLPAAVLMMPVRLQVAAVRRGVGILLPSTEDAAGLPWAFPFSLSLSLFWGFPCFYCTSIQPIPSPVHPSLPMLEGKIYRSGSWGGNSYGRRQGLPLDPKCETENDKISSMWFCCLYCPDPSPALLAQWTVIWIQRSFCACGIFPCGPSHTAANMFSLLWATFMFYFTFYIG